MLEDSPSNLASRPSAAEKPFRFLDLPGEIRNKIYRYLLDARDTRQRGDEEFSIQWCISSNGLFFPDPQERPIESNICISLFYVNKTLHNEAYQFFLSTNLFVRLTILNKADRAGNYALENFLSSCYMPCLSIDPERVQKSGIHALDFKLSIDGSREVRSMLILPISSLRNVIDVLEDLPTIDAEVGNLAQISLAVRNGFGNHQRYLQLQLLEPFRCLHHYTHVKISPSFVGEDFAEGLRKHMAQDRLDCISWYLKNRIAKDRATELLRMSTISTRGYQKLDRAQRIFHNMVARVVCSYRARGKHLVAMDHSVNYKTSPLRISGDDHAAAEADIVNEPFGLSKAVNRLLLQCCLNIGLIYLNGNSGDGAKLGFANQYSVDALRLVKNDPSIQPEIRSILEYFEHKPENNEAWYTDIDRAKVHYRRAVICYRQAMVGRRQGYLDPRVDDYSEEVLMNLDAAHGYSPDDRVIQKARKDFRNGRML